MKKNNCQYIIGSLPKFLTTEFRSFEIGAWVLFGILDLAIGFLSSAFSAPSVVHFVLGR
jgi:hypothetical protein